jgi:hypothetical protein
VVLFRVTRQFDRFDLVGPTFQVNSIREGHFRGGILEVSKERGSGRSPGFYRVRRAEAFFRQAAGGLPTRRLKARLKAYSDS